LAQHQGSRFSNGGFWRREYCEEKFVERERVLAQMKVLGIYKVENVSPSYT